jgi:ubiquinone/menaquinone biosynthesis C-methylase UbiE
MSQRTSGLYALLAHPSVYAAFQRLLVRTDARRVLVDRYIRPAPGMRVLDFGCGPAKVRPYLANVSYTSIDVEQRYIDAASRRYGGDTFIRGDVSAMRALPAGQYDLVIGIAVLHHLSDEDAHTFFAEARRVLRNGGRLVTYDCLRKLAQHPVARMLINMDRGRYVRSEDEYRALAEGFEHVATYLHMDMLRLPYDTVAIVCAKGG